MPKTTSIWIMRHGSTKDNSPSATKDKVKGQLDLGLDDQGRQAAHEAGKALQGSGVTSIVTSQMKRSIETGQIVSGYLPGSKVASSRLLNPWDVGAYTGQSYAHVKDDLSHLQKNPTEAPPEGKQLKGEPYGNFLGRYSEAMPKLLDHAATNKTLLVAHSRHLVALDGLMKGTLGKGVTPVRDVTPPGAVMRLDVWGGSPQAAAPEEPKTFAPQVAEAEPAMAGDENA